MSQMAWNIINFRINVVENDTWQISVVFSLVGDQYIRFNSLYVLWFVSTRSRFPGEGCTFGPGCTYECHCEGEQPCDPNTGDCPNGCDDGVLSGPYGYRGAWDGYGCQIGEFSCRLPWIQPMWSSTRNVQSQDTGDLFLIKWQIVYIKHGFIVSFSGEKELLWQLYDILYSLNYNSVGDIPNCAKSFFFIQVGFEYNRRDSFMTDHAKIFYTNLQISSHPYNVTKETHIWDSEAIVASDYQLSPIWCEALT